MPLSEFTKPCENRNPHMFHNHTVNLVKTCDGKTECGQWSHIAHEYEVEQTVWCNGICDCGIRNEPHGPGAHK